MPFPDEVAAGGVRVQPYRPEWATDGAELAHRLRELVPSATAVEHIGSTSVPGMAAKDCLDMMVVVQDLQASAAEPRLASAGFRRRDEPWNNVEKAYGRQWPKLVFAPAVGERAVNVHVRPAGSGSARLALLFRDHLRAVPHRAATWSDFKTAAATQASDLAAYGQLKLPAWRLLMELAEDWATRTAWEPRLA